MTTNIPACAYCGSKDIHIGIDYSQGHNGEKNVYTCKTCGASEIKRIWEKRAKQPSSWFKHFTDKQQKKIMEMLRKNVKKRVIERRVPLSTHSFNPDMVWCKDYNKNYTDFVFYGVAVKPFKYESGVADKAFHGDPGNLGKLIERLDKEVARRIGNLATFPSQSKDLPSFSLCNTSFSPIVPGFKALDINEEVRIKKSELTKKQRLLMADWDKDYNIEEEKEDVV